MQHVAVDSPKNTNDASGGGSGGGGSRPKASVLKSAAFMAVGTLASRVLGMVREMVLASLFPRIVTDVFVVAFRFPNLFRRVLGEGSIAAAFIPLYVESLGRDPAEAARFRDSVYSMLTALTATLSVLGIIFMEPIMNLMVGGQGFQQIEGKMELTVFMSRIMFSFLYLVTSYAFVTAVANSHGQFFWPGVAPAVFNGMISVCAFLPTMQVFGDQLAWGVIIAGVAQLLVAIWPVWRVGVRPRLTLRWRVPQVRNFFKNVVPSMIGMGIAQFLGVLNVYFASRLGEGTHTYIYLADRLLELPQSLLSVSLGVALLPTLSDLWARGARAEMLSVAQRHVRLLMVLSMPAAVGLFFLAEPIVRVLFERGEFKPSESLITAQVLSIYAFVLVFSSIHRVTVPIFYAVKNTWFPAVNSAACLLIHFFAADYATTRWGILGLVGATAFTGLVNLLVLFGGHLYFVGRLGLRRLFFSALHLVPSLILLAVICKYAFPFMRDFLGGSVSSSGNSFSMVLSLFLTIAGGGLFFFVSTWFTRHPEAREILDLLTRRLRGRF